MDLEEAGLLFWIAVAVLTLLVASPALSRVLVYPRTELFTELWILDADHRAENYPFNVTRNLNYTIYLGIGNRLGYCAYYLVEVKFRNQTQPPPTSLEPIEDRTPSSLPSLFNITAFVADDEVWETPLTFSFDYGFNETFSQAELYNLNLNDVTLDMRDYTIDLDSRNSGFFGNLFFELWIYNKAVSDFRYHGRFVGLWLNMTAPA